MTVGGFSLSVIPGWTPAVHQSATVPVERLTSSSGAFMSSDGSSGGNKRPYALEPGVAAVGSQTHGAAGDAAGSEVFAEVHVCLSFDRDGVRAEDLAVALLFVEARCLEREGSDEDASGAAGRGRALELREEL